MKIKELTLFTNKLSEQKDFFIHKMGFDLIAENPESFSIQVGYSQFNFRASPIDYKYHYCFLIPSNQLDESIEWLKGKVELIKIEGNRVRQVFESWNAESIYFLDGAGNVAEFIVRYNLKNEKTGPFNLDCLLSVNEIGMPSKNVAQLNSVLEKEMNSFFWKGDYERFGTNGTEEGLFLLINYEQKKTWFPTTIKTTPSPFKALIESQEQMYIIDFEAEEIKIVAITN